jgi:hypothetical protein
MVYGESIQIGISDQDRSTETRPVFRFDRCRVLKKRTTLIARPQNPSVVERPLSLAPRSPGVGWPIVARVPATSIAKALARPPIVAHDRPRPARPRTETVWGRVSFVSPEALLYFPLHSSDYVLALLRCQI